MAQGLLKKSSSSTSSKPTKSVGVTKRGSRQINPKNQKLIKAAKINKKFTAGLTAQTERMLGERAGHLELLKGGRKKGAESAAGKKKDAKTPTKGAKKS